MDHDTNGAPEAYRREDCTGGRPAAAGLGHVSGISLRVGKPGESSNATETVRRCGDLVATTVPGWSACRESVRSGSGIRKGRAHDGSEAGFRRVRAQVAGGDIQGRQLESRTHSVLR